MEQKLNIAEILKNKPRGTKLYSMIHGKCSFEAVTDEIFKINFCTSKFGLTQSGECTLIKFGNMYDGGECIIFPSKEMRDWSKFSWKKGDILVNENNAHIIFEKFTNDTYTTFIGRHYFDGNNKSGYSYISGRYTACTQQFHIEEGDAIQTYIFNIEKEIGGKLNLKTLEIDKTQPEFKDGDIIKMTWDKYSAIAIFWEYSNFGKGFDSHVFFNIKTKIIEYNTHGHTLKDLILRLATEEEKQQLFDALAKKGKQWYSEKKMIVDLKPKVELKPFDKVVVRCSKADKWSIDFFSYKVSNGYICTGDAWFGYCLPYNEETAHLLGTTDDWEEVSNERA